MQKISSITLYILGAVTLLLLVLFVVSGITSNNGLEGSNFTGEFLLWGVILLVLSIILVLGFSIYSSIQNPKLLVRSLGVIGIAVVLFLVSFFLASSTQLTGFTGKAAEASAKTIKWVGTGLNLTYILGTFAIVSVIFTEVYRAFK